MGADMAITVVGFIIVVVLIALIIGALVVAWTR